ncbi:protein FAM177B isoform X1 [Xenopus tropicalis]|uniref:LOC100145772 protein n=1 Tax=Xenopus tropicalis TaxID=8364 RepID=B1WBG3_XENTR|nr:protein FAM177B [Xenopus tropicalis]XP_012818206.1 protein FAM177B isoform X1 [Xenopus tropicalis]AAI61745.1 LOC100145772 protein [Xenopus tropicalis]|eukprot:XP_012818206.1 PREDICTED: protein FAM177B isoform X1 [Xenopus tropicalis]
MSDGDVILKEIENGEQRFPRRIIHFASGETMEEYSTEEEEEEEEEERIDFRSVDTAKMSWKSYIQFWVIRIATGAFYTCDFLGGRLATLFGLTVPKYQYAIDEYDRRQEEDSSDEEGQEMPEMAEIQTEKQHLPTQSAEYGTISLKDRPAQYGDDCHMSSETHQSHET